MTLGRTQQISTSVGAFSLHQLTPELFGGFDQLPSGAKLATPEKAVFDLAYLAGTRSRLFRRPPELELPAKLRRQEIRRWAKLIPSSRRRTQVLRQIEALLAQPKS
ncbi:MAG: hypothetical protein ACT4TC_20495 [Myxococcaceae bacterium]